MTKQNCNKPYRLPSILASSLLFLFAALWLTACAPQKSVAATDTGGAPGHEFVQTMLGLYRDEDKFTRIQAMLLSIYLAPREELVQELRERAKSSEDEIERAAAHYALASITRRHEDIVAFLDAFLYNSRSTYGLTYCDSSLIRNYWHDPHFLQEFLASLAILPEYRGKAMGALVFVDYKVAMPEGSIIGQHGLKIPSEEEYAYAKSLSDSQIPLFSAEELEKFDDCAISKRLLPLLDSPDMETRVTLYMMLDRLPLQDAYGMHFYPSEEEGTSPVYNALFARLMRGDMDINETQVLRFAFLSSTHVLKLDWLLDDYLSSLPDDRQGVESLLALEKRTYRKNVIYRIFGVPRNITDAILYSMKRWPGNPPITEEALQKVQAFLRNGRHIINEADYERLANALMLHEKSPVKLEE